MKTIWHSTHEKNHTKVTIGLTVLGDGRDAVDRLLHPLDDEDRKLGRDSSQSVER